MTGPKIMLVDDDAFMLELLKQQLRSLGFEDEDLAAFERSNEALAALSADPDRFNVILCDLQMPDIDGVEFLRYIARLGYCGSLLVMSGQAPRLLKTAESLAQAHGLDVLGTLQKPISTELLLSALTAAHTAAKRPRPRLRAARSPDELRTAITNGHLINHYQPKIDMTSRAVVGVESLVRWQHPTDGLIYPDQFIEMAEQNDLIDQLTHQVLTNALRDARSWRRAGLSLSTAVNVSMRNLASLDFPDLVADVAQRMDIPMANIVLEVTESQLTSNPLVSLDILTRLRLKEVNLSIDDFGTGYSSLAKLRDIPFTELKIDRSFVHRADSNPAAAAIVDASLRMAKALGMTVVAEGVEDQADWDWLLHRASCDLAQGYFIARPMDAAAFSSWLAARQSPLPDAVPAWQQLQTRFG